MENYCTKAKKEHFFPEFLNCTFNSSSVDNEQQRQDRGKSKVEDEEGRVKKRALKETRPNKGWIPPHPYAIGNITFVRFTFVRCTFVRFT